MTTLNNDLPIDHESQAFLSWAFDQLNDQNIYDQLVAEALDRAREYYSQPRETVLAELKAKMHVGALEHGAPNHSHQKVLSELANEYRDLLGWLLVEKWVLKEKE